MVLVIEINKSPFGTFQQTNMYLFIYNKKYIISLSLKCQQFLVVSPKPTL